MITIEQLAISKPNSSAGLILADINCRLAKGTVTLVTGQTGSGKSTFLNAMAGLIPLQQGSIAYDGQSLWKGKRINNAVKFKMGVVFQYPERQLFAESLRKEFAYTLRPLRLSRQEIEARISEAMGRMRLPEELLAESFFSLSDGQKRKLAIAATLAAKPEWLLLDEPTAGIDPMSIPQLLEAIDSHKRADGGVIVVSHDLDTFLPAADRVLIMHNGTIAADVSPMELYERPDLLNQAWIGLPASMAISSIMREQGAPLAGSPLTPDETAEALIKLMEQRSSGAMGDPAPILAPQTSSAADASEAAASDTAANLDPPGAASSSTSPTGSTAAAVVQELHPITKWLFYLLLSSGILLQDQWLGIAASALITCFGMYVSGMPYRTLLKPVKPFIFFILVSALISGLTLTFEPDSIKPAAAQFQPAAAIQTTKQLSVYLLLMLLGILFAVSTSGSKLQKGLEQAFAFLEHARIPVAAFTFSASLLLRFIPMLIAEIDRISLITRARGKADVKHGSVRVRDAHVFMIPLVLSMMKHAEDLAFALEARGYKMKQITRSSRSKLPFRRSDMYTIATGLLLLIVLIMLDWIRLPW